MCRSDFSSFKIGRILVIFLITVILEFCSLGAAQCSVQNACFPWSAANSTSQNPCKRDSRMNLRFLLDVAPENAFGEQNNRYMMYGFCPRVDKLSSFTLNQSTLFATTYTRKDEEDDNTTSYYFSEGMYKNYLSVYGFGDSGSPLVPQRGVSIGSVLVAVNGSLTTCGGPRTVAVVSTLMLNVGMKSGAFNYVDKAPTGLQNTMNPNYNVTYCQENKEPPPGVDYCSPTMEIDIPADSKRPAMVGFESTCKNGKCKFDPGAICIDDTNGLSNCGYCYSDPADTRDAFIQIWVSYFGTDQGGSAFISGGNSPLRYVDFATSSISDKFKDKLSDLWAGRYD